MAEIRDKKARHHLESLPFELKLREPSDEAIKFGERNEETNKQVLGASTVRLPHLVVPEDTLVR